MLQKSRKAIAARTDFYLFAHETPPHLKLFDIKNQKISAVRHCTFAVSCFLR